MAAGQEIGTARALHTDASQAAIPEIHVDQPAFKPDIRSQFQKLLPQVLKDHVEEIRPHMRFGVDQDFLWGTAGD